jgi:hypothetical protein
MALPLIPEAMPLLTMAAEAIEGMAARAVAAAEAEPLLAGRTATYMENPLLAQGQRVAGDLAAQAAGATALATGSLAAGHEMAKLAGKKSLKRKDRFKDPPLPPAQEPGSRIRAPYRKAYVKPGVMPPKGVSTSTHWYDRTRKKWVRRKRPLKKRPSMRKKAYKKRTTRTRRTYKKKKTVKRKYMRSLGSTKYETHGIISRHDVSYFGFAANGGRDEFLHAACDGILRAWAGKFHIAIPTPDNDWYNGPSGSPQPMSYQVSYRKKRYHAGAVAPSSVEGTRRDLTGIVHHVMVDNMAKEFAQQAALGNMPYYVKIFTTTVAANGSDRLYTDPKFGDMLINVTSNVKIKLRNVTNNDGSNEVSIVNSATRNPLEGYAYQFRGEIPVVKEALFNTDENFYARFHHRDNKRGVCLGPQAVPWADTHANVDDPDGRNDDDGFDPNHANTVGTQNQGPILKGKFLSSPPLASKVFTNCAKQHSIVMPIAREFKHVLKAAYAGTLCGLMERYNDEKYRMSSIGNCFWLSLRQKFRNNNTVRANGMDTTASNEDHDDVTVEYDVSTVLRAGARFARPETTPAEVQQLEFNSIDETDQ